MPLVDLPADAQLDAPASPKLVDLPEGAKLDAPADKPMLLGDYGRFGMTAVTRGLGGLADFAMDPLAPLRTLISPGLEHIEESAKFKPGQAAGNAIFSATGIPEYQPTTPLGRVALSTAEGAVGGGPFGIGGAIGGALSGLAGQSTQELTDSERLATAAGLLAPLGVPAARGVVNYTAQPLRETFGPYLSQNYREGLVGDQFRQAARDVAALKDSLMTDQQGPLNQQLVPGSLPTTFQLTADQGIGQLERGVRTRDAAPFLERGAEQNAARVGQVASLAPDNASPSAVRDLLRDRLVALDQEGERNVLAAQQNAQQAFNQTGGQLTPQDYGALMRDQLEAAKSLTKARESDLWTAIDPEGALAISPASTREMANRIVSEIPRTARPPEGEEAAVLGLSRALGGTVPFSEFTALRGRLLQAIRDERANGQTPALRRMQQLRSAMDETISSAAENVAQQEASAGTIRPEASMLSRVQDWAQAWRDAARAEQSAAVGEGISRPDVTAGQGRISPMGRGQGQAGGGFGNAAGAPGISSEPLVPNFDQAAADRYRAAADVTRERAATFNNQFVGPVLAERGTEYRMPESRVPERVFSSPESVQAFLDAGGNRATLRDALAGDLRRSAANPDGTLNPGRYQMWQRRRSAALGAVPELQATFNNAAGATEAMNAVTAAARTRMLEYENGAARHFLNAEPAQAVQSALASKNPVADMRELVRLTSGDKDASAGLQRALADYMAQRFVGNTRAPGADVGNIKSDTFQTFLRRSGPALRQVFTPEQMRSMEAVAADLQRSDASVSGSKIPGQSNTAQDLGLRQALGEGKMSVLRTALGRAAAGATSGALWLAATGDAHGAFAAALGGGALKSAADQIKAAGIGRVDQLMTEALLNPEIARTLLMKESPANRPFIEPKLRNAFGRLAGTGAAQDDRSNP